MKKLLNGSGIGLLVGVMFLMPSAFGLSLKELGALGDGDPFPVACTNFSGEWRSDKAQVYNVQQHDCSWIQIHKSGSNFDYQSVIVPDGKARNISSNEYRGIESHRWNNHNNFGASVETHRTMDFNDHKVTEFVTLEEVNENLILENTYRVIDSSNPDGTAPPVPPQHEYAQQVFRRTVLAIAKPAPDEDK